MSAIYTHEHEVMEDEIDRLGHVNNLAYIKWMLAAATAHSAAQGWPSQRYHDLKAGWVVRAHQIEYLQQTLLGDRVAVHTWVAGFQRARSWRRYRIERTGDGQLLAVAETQWVFISFEHQVPRRVPEEVRQAFQIVTPDAEPWRRPKRTRQPPSGS